MGAVLLAARLVLSLVLVVAGIAKLGDRAGTRQAMRDFGVPGPLAPALGLLLPLAELGAGLVLLPVATAWWGAVAALALLALFLSVIGYSLARGRRPDCHCFGQLHSAPIGSRTVIRNLVLTGLAALVVAQPGREPGPGLLSLIGGITTAMGTAIGIALVALAAAAVNGWLFANLLRQNGRLLLRLDALEERLRAPGSERESTAAAEGAHVGSAIGSPRERKPLTRSGEGQVRTISPRFGVETSVSYVPSNLRFTFDDTETTTDANLLLGTVRATFHAIPMTSPVWLTLNGGVSMIRRGGEAYAEAEDKSDVGGVAGATVGFRLGSMLSFYVAAEHYIYGTRVEATGLADESRTQNDVQIAFGFGFPVGR
ncbi:MAG TPA: MauE/DoxX family redox-associated membrane protein [Gemmatimonadales bacterium]|nr:MauE/DoxX family redox-associated membrane protein [Gemmatimonadales bacterium]